MSSLVNSLSFIKNKKGIRPDRAFELDLLRGIAIVMMMFMHFSYDVRYEFSRDVFHYLYSDWFWEFVHPIIIVLFVGISGVCCSFSKNNLVRGLRLLAIALCFTAATTFVKYVMDIDCLIIFNVLHLLSLSTLVYSLFTFIEKKTKISSMGMSFIIGLIGIYIIILNNNLDLYDYATDMKWLFVFGIEVEGLPSMGDFMPIIPWLGVFLTGSAIGRLCYPEKKTLFADAPQTVRKISKPFEFLGRHSLLIYLVHQPVIYGVLFVIFYIADRVG